ncbi:hypothetical protein GF339_01345 [candidate division KSB3 bacterium]|uniref:Cytochrome oxidase subunit III n=1 Tax=candidate division KSB3 bacterium TaxID=2044937 RepID=A0A9D5JSJ4_9BACT|nr:hypothetical protein [candidate division KSB3 bacterium]MBD3323196.1 hypothetical protein [candidate division KSB3 bacterium]
MKKYSAQKETLFQLSGWILFLLCAVFFIVSSWQHQDMIMLFGSLIFFVACILFVIPLVNVIFKQ